MAKNNVAPVAEATEAKAFVMSRKALKNFETLSTGATLAVLSRLAEASEGMTVAELAESMGKTLITINNNLKLPRHNDWVEERRKDGATRLYVSKDASEMIRNLFAALDIE